ncbi:MAG: hypothetical protein RIS79_1220, partial [Verrucomicrobiota bacterium]
MPFLIMMRILPISSIEDHEPGYFRMLKLAVITLALAFDEGKTGLFQVANEFSDFARHGEG